MVTVSASLIVKDEERFLSACLASLRGHVDEVVVVDTGSTDKTMEIAEQAGARLFSVQWTGSFADARNASLEACRGDWVLYIDADECLRLDPGLTLLEQLSQPLWAGAMVKFRPKSGYTTYWEHRLFRRHPAIRFEGKIHETHLTSLRTFAGERGLHIGRSDVAIEHYGYDGDQSHKHPRNLPLLIDSIAENPARPYYWYHLAESYAALGRLEEALETGERGLRAARTSGSDREAADINLIAQLVARLRIEGGRDPSDVIEDALRRLPGDHATRLLKARWLVMSGDPRLAMPILDELMSVDADRMPPGVMAFDKRIFGRYAREMKAAALVKLGDFAGAGMLLRHGAESRSDAPALT